MRLWRQRRLGWITLGLGLYTRACLLKARADSPLSMLLKHDEVMGAFKTALAGGPLTTVARFDAHATGFGVSLHPAGEPVFVDFDGEFVTVDAKTSCVGPGYHAFLVACLDRIAAELGVTWDWGTPDSPYGDDTDYAHARDFHALQMEMARYRKNLYATILADADLKDGATVRLSMPHDFDAKGDGRYLTTLGPLQTADLEAISRCDDRSLLEAARPHFAWWSEGFDADFYRGLALTRMWMEVRWSAPVDEAERISLGWTLEWSETANRLGAAPAIPDGAIATLTVLAKAAAPSVLPSETGIGYLRRSMTRHITGRWSVEAPGSLVESTEDDGQTVVLWNDELVVRGSSVTINPAANGVPKSLPDDTPVKRDIQFAPSDSGEGFELQATAELLAGEGVLEVGIVTIWMERVELKAVAEQIARSLSYKTESEEFDTTVTPPPVAANENG